MTVISVQQEQSNEGKCYKMYKKIPLFSTLSGAASFNLKPYVLLLIHLLSESRFNHGVFLHVI